MIEGILAVVVLIVVMALLAPWVVVIIDKGYGAYCEWVWNVLGV